MPLKCAEKITSNSGYLGKIMNPKSRMLNQLTVSMSYLRGRDKKMNRKLYSRNTFLMLSIIVFGFTGCGGKEVVLPVDVEKQAFEDLRSEIREAIEDPAREAEAIALVDELAEDLYALRDKISARQQRFRQLHANYDTPRAEFDAFFKQINTEIQSNQKRVTENHRALLATTTPEEWLAISKARTQAMVAAIESLQAI